MDSVPALMEEARAHLERGDLEAARRPLLRALKAQPRNASIWLALAAACSAPQERRLCLQRAVEIDPANAEALSGLAELGLEPPAGDRPTAARSFACPSCGAKMTFRPDAGSLHCAHCSHQAAIEPDDGVEERTFQGTLFSEQAHVWGVDLLFVRCASCGGELALPPQESSRRCPFCGSPQVAEQLPERRVAALDSIIPFQFDAARARALFQEWLALGWSRPADVRRVSRVMELDGVYLPFWTFDGSATARWVAVRSDGEVGAPGSVLGSLSASPSRLALSQRRGETCELFDDATVCASNRVPERMIERVYPFETEQAVAYDAKYLAGWPAEVSQLSLAEASIQGRARMCELARAKAHRDADNQGLKGLRVVSCEASIISYKHLLLPIWLGLYRYGDHSYRVVINGQTGHVWGEAPVSGSRLLLFSFVLTVLIGLAAFVLWLVLTRA